MEPKEPDSIPNIFLIASAACILPITPAIAPITPASAQLGTSPGGGGEWKIQRG